MRREENIRESWDRGERREHGRREKRKMNE